MLTDCEVGGTDADRSAEDRRARRDDHRARPTGRRGPRCR